MRQKRRLECASAVSAIAPIATELLHCGGTRRYRQAEEVDEPTRIDDDTGKSSRGYPAHHRQNRRHSSPKSSGTSPNFFSTTASENSPTFGSPARLNATTPA